MGLTDQLTRRDWMAGTAGAGALAWLGKGVKAQEKRGTTSLDTIFAKTKLADQSSEKQGDFDLPATFNDRPCLILFGYNGCPKCQEITKTVAETQKQLLKAKLDIPIIVISTQPEQDKRHLQDYVKRYGEAKVYEFADDAVARRGQLLKGLGGKDQNDETQGQRILHVVLPENKDQAIDIQQRLHQVAKGAGIKTMRNSGTIAGNAKQHSPYIALFDQGNIKQAFRGLDNDNQASETFAKRQAATIVKQVQGLKEQGRGRD